jgi:hypothetical protein
MRETGAVSLELRAEEALVLFDFLARLSERMTGAPFDPAEQRVLWDLEALLERILVEPLCADYAERLMRARQLLRDEPLTRAPA